MAGPPPVVARITGALDPSVNRSFEQLKTIAERAGRAVGASGRKGAEDASKALQREVAKQQAMANKAAQAQDRLYERVASRAAKTADQEARAAERSADRRARAAERAAAREIAAAKKSQDALAAAATKAANVAAREMARAEKAMMRANQRTGAKFAERTGYAASRFLTPHAPLASIARRTASEVARGIGVDFDLSSSISRGVGREKAAVDLSNLGYQPNEPDGPNGKRVASGTLLAQARGISAKYHTVGTEEALGGLNAFVTKTGDLKTGRDVLEDMTRLAVATGAGLEASVDAAADVSMALGDIPNKGKAIKDVMSVIAGQGKMGAVEIKNLASQMAKITSSANQFEGDVGENIKMLGAFAQVSRGRGGSATATISATSIAGFTNTLVTPARVAAFKKEGIDVFNKAGKIRNPETLLLEAIQKTGADPMRMKKLFANVQGARPVTGFLNIFRDAEEKKKGSGLDAVRERIAEFQKAALNAKAVQENIDLENETTAAKAQDFQNKFDDITNELRSRLLPALEQLGPQVLHLAEIFSSVATWVATNPKQAIALGIGTSIARAVGENVFRAGIERVIMGPNGREGTRAGKVGAAVSKIGGALAIASIVATTFAVANMLVDHFTAKEKTDADKAKEGLKGSEARAEELEKEAAELKDKGDVQGSKDKLKEALAERTKSGAEAGKTLDENQRGTIFGKDRVEWKKALLDAVLGHDKGEVVGEYKNQKVLSETEGTFGIRGALGIRDKDFEPENKAAKKATEELRATNEKNTAAIVRLTEALSSFGDGRGGDKGRESQL